MGALQQFLATIDNAKRVVARNTKDLASNPVGYLQMVADRVNQDLKNPEYIAQNAIGKGTGGLAGTFVGRKGVERLGFGPMLKAMDQEAVAAERLGGLGMETRFQNNGGNPLAHTGWDGAPRYEISDQGLRRHEFAPVGLKVPLKDVFEVPDRLMQAYPDELGSLRVILDPYTKLMNGHYSPGEHTITLGSRFPTENVPNIAAFIRGGQENVMSHELQHVIQEAEGWTKGTNLGSIKRHLQAQPEPLINRNLTGATFLQEIAHGRNPKQVYEELRPQAYDRGSAIELDKLLRDFYENNWTTEDADFLSRMYMDDVNRFNSALQKKSVLQELLDRGIMNKRRSDLRNADEIHTLYRANAGENEANMTMNRRFMNLKERQQNPVRYDADFGPEFLHGVE